MSELDWVLPDRTISFAGKLCVMGIVNVTPDSFSDGGQHATTETAVAHAEKLLEEGADILDIGGESTRPGALPVPLEEELRRVVPVIKELAKRTAVPLSVDTYKAEVARQSCAVGASIINDVTGLLGDKDMVQVAQDAKAGLIVMHMQNTPATMQVNPHYKDVVKEVGEFFRRRLEALEESGIPKQRIVLDPGIGFGKTVAHNLSLLARLEAFQKLGLPVLLGASRKGFMGKLLNRELSQRLPASLAVVCFTRMKQSAQIFRVHDVQATCDVLKVIEALESSGENFAIQ
jgi:dihydropteroate synthase